LSRGCPADGSASGMSFTLAELVTTLIWFSAFLTAPDVFRDQPALTGKLVRLDPGVQGRGVR